jgi:hypothetical protein
MQDEIRAVIEVARTWLPSSQARYALLGENLEQADIDLINAVKAFEDALVIHGEKQPAGLIGPSVWGEVQPGWWVQTPKGEWLEVTAMEDAPHDPDICRVSLRVGDKVGTYSRFRGDPVKARMRTKAVTPEDALAMFAAEFPGTEILEEK